jgi:hypothetical protein
MTRGREDTRVKKKFQGVYGDLRKEEAYNNQGNYMN